MIGILLLTSILVIITICLLFGNLSSFKKVSNFQTVPTVEEQRIENDEFLDSYNKIKKRQEEQEKNEIPFTWNPNNTLESMRLEPCLSDRLTCFSAPAWWYPENKYNKDNFRVVNNSDRFNPIYNYLGNAQEMFWDFKSVKDTFSTI